MGSKAKTVSDPFAGFLLKHKKGDKDASDDNSDQDDDAQDAEVDAHS